MTVYARPEIGWSSERTATADGRRALAEYMEWSAAPCAYCGGQRQVFDRTPEGLVPQTCPACLGIGSWHR